MTYIISLLIYIVVVSWLGWIANRSAKKSIYDVHKNKNGSWVWNDDFKTGSILNLPIECLNDTGMEPYRGYIISTVVNVDKE